METNQVATTEIDTKSDPKSYVRLYENGLVYVAVGHEWGYFTVHETTGLFQAYTSYGRYACVWLHHGFPELKDFLPTLGFDYFMSKVGGSLDTFSLEVTVNSIKQVIFAARRRDDIEDHEARFIYEHVNGIEADTVDGFIAELTSCGELMTTLGDDWYDHITTGPSANDVAFWDVLWPLYSAWLKREIVAESFVRIAH